MKNYLFTNRQLEKILENVQICENENDDQGEISKTDIDNFDSIDFDSKPTDSDDPILDLLNSLT